MTRPAVFHEECGTRRTVMVFASKLVFSYQSNIDLIKPFAFIPSSRSEVVVGFDLQMTLYTASLTRSKSEVHCLPVSRVPGTASFPHSCRCSIMLFGTNSGAFRNTG